MTLPKQAEEGKPMGLAGSGRLSRRDFTKGTIGVGVALAACAKAQINTRKRMSPVVLLVVGANVPPPE